ASDGGSVLQSRAGHLHRVGDASSQQVHILAGGGVQALAGRQVVDLILHNARLEASVAGDLLQRTSQSRAHDLHAGCLVALQAQVVLQDVCGLHQCSATAGNNALLGSSLRVAHGILDAVLALLQLHLGGGTDLQDGHAAGELRQALLQLLAVVVGVSVLDLLADLLDATLQLLLGASTIDNGGVVLGDNDLAGGTQQRQVGGLQVQADLLGDDLAASQDRDVLQLSLTAVTEARSLHSNGLEGAADLVHNEGGQCLALDVLSHDQQRLAGLHDLLQQRQQILDVGDLGAHQQDVRILQHSLATLDVGGEVAGDVTLIEAHTLRDGEVHAESVGLLDGDHTVLIQLAVADLIHSL